MICIGIKNTLILLCNLLLFSNSYRAILVDQNSFISRDISFSKFLRGLALLNDNPVKSYEYFRSSVVLYPTYLALENALVILELLGRNKSLVAIDAQEYLDRKLQNVRTLILRGRQENTDGKFTNAVNFFDAVLNEYPFHPEALFLKASSLERLGEVDLAVQYCMRTLDINPIYTKALLNLGSIFQKYGQVEESAVVYKRGLFVYQQFAALQPDQLIIHDEHIKMSANLGIAYFQKGIYREAIKEVETLKSFLIRALSLLNPTNKSIDYLRGEDSLSFIGNSLRMLIGNEVIIKRSACLWKLWEENYMMILKDSLHFIETRALFLGPLLPFDTMLFHVSMLDKLVIARAAAFSHEYAVQSYRFDRETKYDSAESDVLKIGMISYDFNDHPTTRLIEGIFHIVKNLQSNSHSSMFKSVMLFVYSYGKHDNSSYRTTLENLSHRFYNIANYSHQQSVNLIMSDKLDVLLEMQLHTLGNRLEITAAKPCPSIINYLVYPGTSGATYIDYIVSDRIVLPVEHAQFYSESLILLPPTYQISYYDNYDDLIQNHIFRQVSNGTEMMGNQIQLISTIKQQLRRFHELPIDSKAIIFCNFNKMDKLEPITFAVWMNILRSVPNSYLWLLKPASSNADLYAEMHNFTTQNNFVAKMITSAAQYHGIHPKRIIFADRVPKELHIERHSAADIFLDSFIYGAHSTATDALRGGLPVLTSLGDSFPNRVGSSLYHSFKSSKSFVEPLQTTLIADSMKQYENVGSQLAADEKQLLVLKKILWHYIQQKNGLFNAFCHVQKLLVAVHGVKELAFSGIGKWNIVVIN